MLPATLSEQAACEQLRVCVCSVRVNAQCSDLETVSAWRAEGGRNAKASSNWPIA